jgi:hypothetical protein
MLCGFSAVACWKSSSDSWMWPAGMHAHTSCIRALRMGPSKSPANVCMHAQPTAVPLYERLCEDGELAQAIGLGQHLLDELEAIVELLLHRTGMRSHATVMHVSGYQAAENWAPSCSRAPPLLPACT